MPYIRSSLHYELCFWLRWTFEILPAHTEKWSHDQLNRLLNTYGRSANSDGYQQTSLFSAMERF